VRIRVIGAPTRYCQAGHRLVTSYCTIPFSWYDGSWKYVTNSVGGDSVLRLGCPLRLGKPSSLLACHAYFDPRNRFITCAKPLPSLPFSHAFSTPSIHFPRMAVHGVLAKFVCSLESFSFWARKKRLKRSSEQPRAKYLQKSLFWQPNKYSLSIH